MQKIKIIVRVYTKKDGGKFVKLSIGGKYINDVLADESQNYQVKFTSGSQVKEPTEEGIYEVAFNDGEAWIDTRDEFLYRFIYRVCAQKVKFSKRLPKLERDVRFTSLTQEQK